LFPGRRSEPEVAKKNEKEVICLPAGDGPALSPRADTAGVTP
jgi:hypothetical protein